MDDPNSTPPGDFAPPVVDGAAPPPPPRPRRTRRRVAIGAVLLMTAAGAAGAAAVTRTGLLTAHESPAANSSTTTIPTPPSSSSATTPSSGPVDANSLATGVDGALVDVNTTLGVQHGQAAGTGIVLTSNGIVLTNNHVIRGATAISVTDIGNGRTYTATVVGYDVSADVAVLRLQGASGLQTANIGNSSQLQLGDTVVAVGNAGGVGGTPSVSSGSVTGLDQSITASDGGSAEQLSGLVETDAALQPGDSGGPLLDSAGQVVGMDTAASTGGGGFRVSSGSDSYAIPIDTALSIARQIEAGSASSTVHIGATAFLGVEIAPNGSGFGGFDSSGAAIAGVVPGTPAASAGLAGGDVITAVNGQTVDSPTTLNSIMAAHRPGDSVQVTWTDQSGQSHTATVHLTTGPAS